MSDGHRHRVGGRMVGISQPHVRPMVRGKAKSPVEFGPKHDVSIDGKGHARLEKASFEPYDECGVFKDAVERYRARTGHYPARALVDRIYRTRENRDFRKEHGITMCGRGAWTARQAGQGVTAERGQGRGRPNRSRAVLQQGKAHLRRGAACHQAGGDDLGKPGAVGVRRQPVRNPGHGFFLCFISWSCRKAPESGI